LPHHEDKNVWSHPVYTIGSNKSPFYKGEAQISLLPSFTSHQIWKKPMAKTFCLKLIIENIIAIL
jgi:hypothetical protein